MLKEKLQHPILEEREVLLNEAESLAQMGSWKWTESTNQLVWSAGLYKIFDKNQNDIISWDTFLENVLPVDSPLVEEFLHEIKINRKGSTIDYRITRDGFMHYLSLTAKPHTIKNIDILGAVVDITKRKEYEKQLEQSIIAERLSITGRIARTIAHEVRNPLTNLNLAIDQLRVEIPIENESVKLYIDIIERNAYRIERLIDEMLNSSKPRKLELEPVNAVEMINETISLAIDRIKLREIHLVFTCQKELAPILVDKEQVQIALLNIIINAAEAMMPKKGILKIGAFQENDFLKVSISDNGKGIPADDLGKLFDPFFTNKPGGKGLGLTSTKNILNSHNAQIEVKSELEKGTTFNMYFRFAE